MRQKTNKIDRRRINIRIPAALLDWVRLYANRKNTTVTQVIVNSLTDLKEEYDD